MPLVADKIIEEVQERVGDKQKQDTLELEGYLKEVALELTQKFDNSLTERVATDIPVDPTTNVFVLPDNIGQVISVLNGINEFDLIGLEEFQVRGTTSDPRASVKIIQDRNQWTGVLLGNAAASTTVDVVYRIRSDDITVIPDEYRELVSFGVESRYHLRHSGLEKYREYKASYTEMKKQMFEDLERNTNKDHRFKRDLEIETSRSLRAALRDNEIDYR